MKKSNIVLVVILVLLVLTGWGVQFLGIAHVNSQYNEYLQQADQFNQAGLYQKAAQSYESALQIKEDRKVRELWVECYGKAYLDKAVGFNTYVAALESMCSLYEKDTIYWECLLAAQMENGKINNAYETFMRFKNTGLSSTVIDGYANDILYVFRTLSKTYLEYVRNTTGYYTVRDARGWGIIRPNGESVYDCMYEYVSPYNANYDALFISEKGQRIADAEAVVQAKINIAYTKTGAWGDGLLPVCGEDGEWYYLNCKTNEKAHGPYKQASNYAFGIAAVSNGSEWILINTAGERVCQKNFSDVKLHGNGDYQYDGIMIASENGEYGVYDANGNLLHDFRAKDMDIYMGENIAYCDQSTGKWGMVTKDGEISIAPAYAAAKSFSNGLAAVSDGELWGFVNTEGEVVIKHQFFDADYFTNGGLCAVSLDGKNYNFIQLKFFGV